MRNTYDVRQPTGYAISTVAAVLFCTAVNGTAAPDMDFGFIAGSDLNLAGNRRVKVAGPVFEVRTAADGLRFLAVRPVFSYESDPTAEQSTLDILWPLASIKDLREQRYWRFATAFGLDVDRCDPKSEYHVFVLPLVFTGRDRHGEGYFAVFPLGGKINNLFMGRDVVFVLFPLYSQTEYLGTTSTHVLWPIFSRTKGPGTSGFKVFPLYGRLTRERDGKREFRTFVLWPVWSFRKTERGEGMVVFPLGAYSKSDGDRTIWILPPFFRFIRGKEGMEANCPWPIVQLGPHKTHIWPIWGTRQEDGTRTSFLLWPIVRRQTSVTDRTEISRLFVLPVVNYERVSRKAADEDAGAQVVSRRFKLWPLASYYREKAKSRFRMPDLWPAGSPGEVERNLAPLWTLYSRERSGDASDSELLWGLFRRRQNGAGQKSVSVFPLVSWERDKSAGRFEWSVLKGVLGYKRENERRSYRVLFVRIGGGPS